MLYEQKTCNITMLVMVQVSFVYFILGKIWMSLA